MKQQRPPAQTERSRCELSSRPKTRRERRYKHFAFQYHQEEKGCKCFNVSWETLFLRLSLI